MPALSLTTAELCYVAATSSATQAVESALERAEEGVTVTGTTPADGVHDDAVRDFDCIVVDEDAPSDDGEPLLERVCELYPDTPVVLFTGAADRGRFRDALAAGATDVVPKAPDSDGYDVLVTRVREALDQHRLRHQYYESMLSTFDRFPFGVLVETPDRQILSVNDRFCDLFDVEDPDQLVGRDCEAAVAAVKSRFERPEQFERLTNEAVAADTTTSEERFRLRDGRVIERSYLPVELPLGDGGIWIYEAVTDAVEREAQLQRYETIVETTGDPEYTLDEDGTVTFVNEALIELTGYDEESLVGSHISRIMSESDVEQCERVIRSLVSSSDRDRQKIDMDLRTADGESIPCENHLGLLGDEEDFEGTVGVLREISSRKRREEHLEIERDRLEAVFDASPNPYVHVNFEGTEPIVERVNEAFEETFGYEEAEILGEPLDEYIVPEENFAESRDINEQAHEGHSVTREVIRETADGERRKFLLAASSVADVHGNREGMGTYVDITERERRIEMLEQIKRNISDVVWMSTPGKEEMDFVSDAYEDIWGRSPESLKESPMSFMDAIHPDDRERVLEAIETQTADPDSYEETYRVVKPDGEIRWVRDRSEGVYEDGELVRVIGVASDITDRKQREQELEQERVFIDQALDALEDIFYVVEPDGTVRRWNDRLPEVTGYTDEEIAEMSAVDLFRESDQDRIAEAVAETLSEGQSSLEAYYRTADGEEIAYELTGARLNDPNGQAIGVVGIGRDISERLERERELRTFQEAVENAGHAMFWTDSQGAIEYVNPAFEEQTGYAAEEAVGKTPALLGADAQPQSFDSLQWAGIEQGETWEDVFVNRRKDGQRYIAKQVISPVYEDGSIERFVGIAADITERHQREQQLSVLQRVLRHDLRNNLNEILLASQLLRQELPDSESVEHLDAIQQTVDETLSLANKVRELRRVFEREEKYNKEIDLAERTRTQLSSIQTERADVEFSIDLPAEARTVSNELIDQAIRNVVQNAIEHNDADTPKITVTLERRQQGEEIELSIADNGPGIPERETEVLESDEEEQLEHLSGFGLWLVNWIVSLSGGGLEFEDNDPTGTVVKLVLPAADRDAISR